MACHLPPLSLLDLCGARGREQGLKVPSMGVKHALRVSWLQGPRPEGPAEWRFHRPLRGGNEFQAGFWCPLPPLLRPAQCWEDWERDSTGVWTVSAAQLSAPRGGAGGGRERELAGGESQDSRRIPGARPSSWGAGRGRGASMSWLQPPHPAQPSLGGGTKGS